LSFRDLVIIFMTFNRPQVTQDSWLYFPDINLSFGRLHEPKNWSVEMSPEGKTSLVVEWFAWRDDPVWKMQNDEIVDIVSRDLQRTGIWDGKDLEGYRIIRLKDAYPIYTLDYQQHLDKILDYLFSIEGMYSTGRNGLFRYTSGDRCMEIGMKTAEVVLGEGHDLRSVAMEQEYAEEK
jgi:protoporphyrinogen oxidase